ncbi:hypothetical protein CHS0354_041248 [Potamilus streckersoni]|uniref:Uncharacterized protein n=1 Tax=Potamilus streckersoni TaxID=2493646 RepID=A0AAE0VU78_9BIVA|nr:hypothetical protein CHS0354_041248 [Potamilus streckersoni]
MDLNMVAEEPDTLFSRLKIAEKLGYDMVAINHVVEDMALSASASKKEKKKKIVIPHPDKVKVDDAKLRTNNINVSGRPFKQCSRLSTIITDPSAAHRLHSPEVQQYDLIAVQPTSEKTFLLACKTLNVDIITIDVTQKLSFQIKRSLLNLAMERGLFFEIQYSPAIRDNSLRKYTISNAHQLVLMCKGKNVILTSGCKRPIELRGPLDVANLGVMFGLTEAQAKAAVSTNCRAVLYHAEARRLTKSTIGVEKISLPITVDAANVKQNDVSEEPKQKKAKIDDSCLLEHKEAVT